MCDFPFGEWALRHLLILFRLWLFFFFFLFHFFKFLFLRAAELLPFKGWTHICVYLCATSSQKLAFQSTNDPKFAPFPPVNHKWTCTSLHLSWLSVFCVLFVFPSGRRCRSTMWRQVSSTKETSWTARCLTATAMFWPASPWRSSLVRFLCLPSSLQLWNTNPFASPPPFSEPTKPSPPHSSGGPRLSQRRPLAFFSPRLLFRLWTSFPKGITWPCRTPPDWFRQRQPQAATGKRINLTPLQKSEIYGWNITLLPGKLATQYTVMAGSSDRAAF